MLMAATAVAALAVWSVPLFGLEHLITTGAILDGVLAFFVRRELLGRTDAIACVAVPPVAWVGVRSLTWWLRASSRLRAAGIPHDYLLVTCALTAAFVIAGTVIGVAIAERHPRTV
jgi:hypothetical protein